MGTAVKPGDHITASVNRTDTSYALTLTDSTTSGNTINVTETCAAATCQDTSAEWIGERDYFASPNGISPLAQFKTPISFTSASETAGGKTDTYRPFAAGDLHD